MVVQAEVNLLPSNKGGRSGYVKTKYRPNFVFYSGQLEELWEKEKQGYFFAAREAERFGNLKNSDGHFFMRNEKLSPGETSISIIDFPRITHLANFLTPGVKFIFREGGRVVGSGEIRKILGESSGIKWWNYEMPTLSQILGNVSD